MRDYKLRITVFYIALTLTPAVFAASCQHLKRIERSADMDGVADMDTADNNDGVDSSESQEQQSRMRTDELEEQQLRLEYIKQQILARLGMSEPPRVRRKPMELEACK